MLPRQVRTPRPVLGRPRSPGCAGPAPARQPAPPDFQRIAGVTGEPLDELERRRAQPDEQLAGTGDFRPGQRQRDLAALRQAELRRQVKRSPGVSPRAAVVGPSASPSVVSSSAVASCRRELMPSFRYAFPRCQSTVLAVMDSRAAICGVDSPLAASAATDRSVGVRAAGPDWARGLRRRPPAARSSCAARSASGAAASSVASSRPAAQRMPAGRVLARPAQCRPEVYKRAGELEPGRRPVEHGHGFAG